MEKTILSIGVRELVEFVLRAGDLEIEFAGTSRAADAVRIHQKIQYARPSGYSAEVAISHQVETPAVILAIGGRIDGVFETAAIPVIDEIKTTRHNPDDCLREENPLHWGQAKVYAFLYAAERGLKDVGVQLTYARLDTGETRETRRYFPVVELQEFFEDLVGRYLEWAAVLTAWQRQRDISIRDLEFPFGAFRPGQQEMVHATLQAIQDAGRIFIQAATGIGKTIAVLFPAVKTIADHTSAKVFYLTARTTGRMAAEKALDELHGRGMRLKRLSLTAKERICFNPASTCRPEECDFAKGHYDRLPAARRRMFQKDAWTQEEVSAAARQFQVCPFEFSLDLSRWADLIICDYNYAFDPKAYLRRFFLDVTGDYAFLVDEAHNLVDRSRDMFSAELRKRPLLGLRRAVKAELPAVHRCLGRINTWMREAHKRCEAAGAPLADPSPPEELYPLLQAFLSSAEKWLEKNMKSSFREELLERYFEIGGFLRVAEQFDESYATCFETLSRSEFRTSDHARGQGAGRFESAAYTAICEHFERPATPPPGVRRGYGTTSKDLRVKLFCIDPSRQIGDALNRCRSAVFFSATLTPLDYFQTMLASESAEALALPSPFPPENLGVFIADRLSTYFRHRDRTKPEIARIALSLVKPHKGNYLLFFPSYHYMRMVLEAFLSAGPNIDVIVQEPGMSERQREAFLGRFETDNPRTLVGFAVMGGIFGEGIDLVGTRLSGAAVVGVGLPAVGLERELIREYFAARLEQGFEYAYLYPGINRVLQAAGRVIRTDTDRGVVLLIDQRYGSDSYRSLLPEHWRTRWVRNRDEFTAVLLDFWGPGQNA